jgi:hypothetical protein
MSSSKLQIDLSLPRCPAYVRALNSFCPAQFYDDVAAQPVSDARPSRTRAARSVRVKERFHESPLGRVRGSGGRRRVGQVSGLVVIMKRASSMSRDEVVAFLRSIPAVDSGSNSGGRTLLAERSSRLRTSAATDQRNAAPAKLSPSLYSTISTAFVVARGTAVARLRPTSVRVLAAVEARALGATVIGGWYLADRTFGT